MNTQDETFKYIIDGLSVITVIGALADFIPSMAALFTIVWTGIRIYETATIQKLLGKEPGDAGEE